MRIYRPVEKSIVLGRGSQIEKEIDVEHCTNDDIDLRRRAGGGCAVVLDPGNVIVSIALPVTGLGKNDVYIRMLSDWIISALHRLGFKGVEQNGVSDIVWNDKKIGGSCVYRTRNVLYYSVSLLVSADLPMLERYLKHPPREPGYRRGRRHSDFVINLSEHPAFTSLEHFALGLGMVLGYPEIEPQTAVAPVQDQSNAITVARYR